jgi:YfiH family protein
MTNLEYLTSQTLHTPHAFFTRHGGVSKGVFNSLNCGLDTDDTPENALENRTRAAKLFHLTAPQLCTLKQVHSNKVVNVIDSRIFERADADALVTKNRDIILGVLSADCCPILFFDEKHFIIGAAHAGWRGAFSGIAQETIKAMVALGANERSIHAVTGPCIGEKSYEVDQGFYDQFITENASNSRFFSRGKPGHHYFNLRAFIDMQLKTMPLASIEHIERDTCAEPETFFSYRHNYLNHLKGYGCQLSAITLPR